MKGHLQFISTVGMTSESWLAYRAKGIGASEVSTILGLNPYKSSIELFYEKIGDPIPTVENMAMFMGKEQEAFIAELWQYWQGSPESVITNYRAGKKIRRCQRVNAYVRNPKFPHLFVSLDRKMNRHGNKDEGALEIKTISGWEANKWEGDIPPAHVIQLQTQLMVCEFEHGELAVLKDGRDFMVYPFEPLPEVQATIANATSDFWQRVTHGRILINQRYEAQRTFNMRLADECEARLHDIEPAADGSDAFTNYLKEKYRQDSGGEMEGTPDLYELAVEHDKCSRQIKEAEKNKALVENRLKKAMGTVPTINFGTLGKVHWKTDSSGKRRFMNKIKPEP